MADTGLLRDGHNYVPDDINGYNWFLENHCPKNCGCAPAYAVLKGIVPQDRITCTGHCPFPKCIVQATPYKSRKWHEALVFGFQAGRLWEQQVVINNPLTTP